MKLFARTTFWALGLATMAASIFLVGCGSNSSGGGTANAPGILSPLGPTPATCAANQVMTAYGCLYVQSCNNGYGWLPGENKCVPAIVNSNGTIASGNFVASLSVSDSGTFALFLQNIGVCSPAPYGVWYGGYASCNSYSQAAYMILQMSGVVSGVQIPSSALVVIGAGTSTPGAPNQNGSTGGMILQPSFNANLAYANGNAGFTGTGPYGFRFVTTGLPGNSYQMGVELQYNGITFARGNLIAR